MSEIDIERYLRHKVDCNSRLSVGGFCTCGRDEAVAKVARLRRVEGAARKLKPFMYEEGMEGETDYERACLELWAALRETEPK